MNTKEALELILTAATQQFESFDNELGRIDHLEELEQFADAKAIVETLLHNHSQLIECLKQAEASYGVQVEIARSEMARGINVSGNKGFIQEKVKWANTFWSVIQQAERGHLEFKRLDLLEKLNAVAGGMRLKPAEEKD